MDGYQNEIHTIYGQLNAALNIEAKPAPDEWDRLFNVDFYIQVEKFYLGIQIKPITFKHTFEEHKWQSFQEESHKKFQNKYKGKVFTIYSTKVNDKKVIVNNEVIEEIKNEIDKLKYGSSFSG